MFKFLMVMINAVILTLVIQILIWCYEPIDIPVDEEPTTWEETIKSCEFVRQSWGLHVTM